MVDAALRIFNSGPVGRSGHSSVSFLIGELVGGLVDVVVVRVENVCEGCSASLNTSSFTVNDDRNNSF